MQNQAPVSAGGSVAGVDRPWQATTLGVLDVIGVVFAFLFAVMSLFLRGVFEGFLSSAEVADLEGVSDAAGMSITGLGGLVGGMMVAVGVFFVFLGILGIFMARGAFKGQKWSPITTIVLAGLAIVGAVSDFNFDSSVIVGLVINVFMIYLAFACMRHQYFGAR